MVPDALEPWSRLTADLKRKVAGHMAQNDAAANLRLVDSDTAAALRGVYDTIALSREQESDEGPPQAQQPWPGHAFLAHWGRPDPWRSLTLPQRRRLLCLAASSGHGPSLEAALAHCGCNIPPQALTAAAAVGNLPVCRQLCAVDGVGRSREATTAAAAGGHLPVLQLLLDTPFTSLRFFLLSVAARGACAGGQAGVLTWLQREQGCRTCGLAEEAARAGQVALLEGVLLPQLQAHDAAESAEEEGAGEGGAAPPVGGGAAMRAAQRRWQRWQLLQAIAHGCPVEVLERHYDALWAWGRRRRAGQGQAQQQQQQQPPPPQQQQQHEHPVPEEFAEEDEGLDRMLGQLLAAAAGSPTRCWAAKLQLLCRKWGPVVARQVASRQRCDHGVWECAHRRPDFLARLQALHAAGVPLDSDTVQWAAAGGHADALAYLWDKCGLQPPPPPQPHQQPQQQQPQQQQQLELEAAAAARKEHLAFVARQVLGRGGSPGHLAVLRLLRERGHVFSAQEVAREARCSSDAALTWMAEVAAEDGARGGEGGLGQEARRWWSEAWAAAAWKGHGTAVLRALRRRGAAVRLDAVAAGGSVEALEWAAEELEAEGGYGALQVLTPQQAREAADNTATTTWLRTRGLLQPEEQ